MNTVTTAARLALLAAIGTAAPGYAQSAADAVVSRFTACLGVEGGSLGDDEAAALAGLADDMVGALGAEPCEADPEGADCLAAISGMDCDALAEAWSAPLGVPGAGDAGEAAPWAVALAGAVTGRVVSCFVAETGADLSDTERAALDGFGSTLAPTLSSVTDNMGCTASEEGLPGCVAAVGSLDCAALAGDLSTGAFATALAESCADLFECAGSAQDAEIEALFEESRR